MVQGHTKNLQQQRKPGSSSSTSGAAKKKAAQPKKGRRHIAPKKAAAVRHAALQKTLSAKIHDSIERQIASAAETSGKLALVKPPAPAAGDSSKTKR